MDARALTRDCGSAQILVVDAEEFGDAACVGETTNGMVRRVAFENLRDLAEAGIVKMLDQAADEVSNSFTLGALESINLDVSITVRSNEPWPDCPLMIGAITLPAIAGVPAAIFLVFGRKSAQSVWRKKMPCDNVEHSALLRLVER